MQSLGTTCKLLLTLILWPACFLPLPALGQQPLEQATPELVALAASVPFQDARDFHTYWMPNSSESYVLPRPHLDFAPFERVRWASTPGTIGRMESAFYCNDTPFIDQVRLPLATLWRGRLKFTGFESDITTANFVLGLPGQGSLHNLSAFGNAFLATHTPPSDQIAGIHVAFSLHATGVDPSENSARHGIEYLVRASRGALPFFNPRYESAQVTLR